MNQTKKVYYTLDQIANAFMIVSVSSVGLIGGSYAYGYYKKASGLDAKIRAKEISKFTIHKKVDSVRVKDVELIKVRLTLKPYEINSTFSVLTGPRGVGKTVAVESAAENLKGIIQVETVKPGTRPDEIIENVLAKITGRDRYSKELKEFAKKVIDAYRSNTGKVPVIIIRSSEGFRIYDLVSLTEASRVLVDDFGLNVFIDSCENAFPDEPKTGHEFMIELERMSWDMMRQLPDFKDLFEMLKSQGNEEVVLAICSGLPLLLNELNQRIKAAKNDEEKSIVVRQFVMNQFFAGKNEIKLLINRYPKIKDVLKMYEEKENAQVTFDMLIDKLDKLDTINVSDFVSKINGALRQEQRSYGNVLRPEICPATGAIAILLRMGTFNSVPDFDDIKKTISMWYKQKENEIEKKEN